MCVCVFVYNNENSNNNEMARGILGVRTHSSSFWIKLNEKDVENCRHIKKI